MKYTFRVTVLILVDEWNAELSNTIFKHVKTHPQTFTAELPVSNQVIYIFTGEFEHTYHGITREVRDINK